MGMFMIYENVLLESQIVASNTRRTRGQVNVVSDDAKKSPPPSNDHEKRLTLIVIAKKGQPLKSIPKSSIFTYKLLVAYIW